jgi:hypothetical protein
VKRIIRDWSLPILRSYCQEVWRVVVIHTCAPQAEVSEGWALKYDFSVCHQYVDTAVLVPFIDFSFHR